MNKIKSHFRFNAQERRGLYFILLTIVIIQASYFLYLHYAVPAGEPTFVTNKELQVKIEQLKKKATAKDTVKIFSFNPNFTTDYKGYVLGMSTTEIDRLHAFRKQNKFANNKEEFQEVTRVSDSLLNLISPYFKFPVWATSGKLKSKKRKQFYQKSPKNTFENTTHSNKDIDHGQYQQIIDLNKATAEELQVISGIGITLSARIVKFRDRLGGFLVDAQLSDVYGLKPEVVERALERFKIFKKPEIEKINVNTASAYELSKLVYIQKKVAQRIVEYRILNNGINSLDELENIEDFPIGKIDRLALYLSY